MSNNSGNNISNQTKPLITTTYNECPDLLSLHLNNKQRYPFLLQSTSQNNKNSRFDILFSFPQERLVLKNNSKLYLNNKLRKTNNFLTVLDELWADTKTIKENEKINVDIPFFGGWFLYLAYEFLGQIEEKIPTHTLTDKMDIAVAVRIPAAIICDRKKNLTHIVSEHSSIDYISTLTEDFEKIKKQPITNSKLNLSHKIKEEPPEYFINHIKKAKNYIYEGDIFQSNLSRKWSVIDTEGIKSVALYNNLRNKNPSAFSGIAKFKNLTIICSSPERLIKVENNNIETRPIAGTIQRSENKIEDSALANALLNHPKERAEHIMLVDMERNDIGKVCKAGTVEVNEMMTLETLPHVHHIVSNIKGKLKDGVTPGEIIKAVFPGGSITGCPKVRCMEIIYELEKTSRNSYTGSMGYLNNNGDMDLNILIRTIEKTNSSITFRTGSGIVNDSNAENELQETRNKAKGLLAAIS